MRDNPARPPSFLRRLGNKKTIRRLSDDSKRTASHADNVVAKMSRNLVDISSPELSRYWCKHLKKSKPEIEAAIAKVGNNAATVLKELSKGSRDSIRARSRAQLIGPPRVSFSYACLPPMGTDHLSASAGLVL